MVKPSPTRAARQTWADKCCNSKSGATYLSTMSETFIVGDLCM